MKIKPFVADYLTRLKLILDSINFNIDIDTILDGIDLNSWRKTSKKHS